MVQAERATFEQVKKAQQKLVFHYMLKLEKANSFLDSKDRESFWDAFDTACLGEASKHRFILDTAAIKADMGSVSEFCKKMIFFEPAKNGLVNLQIKSTSYDVSMRRLWKALREQLVMPMDAALSKSHSASAELLTHARDGFDVGEKTDRKKSKTS